MCVSLLERVKQGKSNIILILILSARSQDRDQQGSAKRLLLNYFNPLGRKTETRYPPGDALYRNISIHSVARPRLQEKAVKKCQIHFNPLGRKTETTFSRQQQSMRIFQSTRSQDRDSKTKQLLLFNFKSIFKQNIVFPRCESPGDFMCTSYSH